MATASHHADGHRLEEAIPLMQRFAERTGIESNRPRDRYLWTDAFAVCNFLALAGATADTAFGDRALRLIDQVHVTLGHHRPDDERRGWISRLDESEGREHPTLGGLRIGKPLPERRASEPYDARREWERDGQYFHYLTKWMHALDQTSRATGVPRYNLWARELARTACAAFIREWPGAPPHLAWKMSIDLSRPLVDAPGLHDALDGFVTLTQLRATAASLAAAPVDGTDPHFEDHIALLDSLSTGADPITVDLLGIGGLLGDADRLARLLAEGAPADPSRLIAVLQAALDSLLLRGGFDDLRRAAVSRMAFRELGFSIGLAAIDRIRGLAPGLPARSADRARILSLAERLVPFARLGAGIESFWRDPENRDNASWREHNDINEVMLATRLVPDGFFLLPLAVPPRGAVGEEAR